MAAAGVTFEGELGETAGLFKLPEFVVREGEGAEEEPVVAVRVLERIEEGELLIVAADVPAETDEPEGAVRLGEEEGIARELGEVLLDHRKGFGCVSIDRGGHGRDVLLLAASGTFRKFKGTLLARGRGSEVTEKLLSAGECDVGEGETFIGSDGIGEASLAPHATGEVAINRVAVGGGRLEGWSREFEAVAVFREGWHGVLRTVRWQECNQRSARRQQFGVTSRRARRRTPGMSHLRDLVERYTTIWNEKDVAALTTMVLDGCIRHDPGATVRISHAENVARFKGAHEQFPGLQLTNAWMWEQGADTITVAYQMKAGESELAGIEVFRFADDRIVEVWNAPAGPGLWKSSFR